MSIRFAAVGLSHNHIFGITDALIKAGAELVWFFGTEPEDRLVEFAQKYPHAKRAESVQQIVEDSSIQVIAAAPIPNERADLGLQVMQHGKDYLCAKPGFTTLEQLAEVRRVQAATGRIYSIYYGERFGNAATVKAGELVQAGAIGRVIQTLGLGPHRLFGYVPRPEWSFHRECYGGIINDLASHQIDQFLYFTGSTSGEIVSSQVANFNHPQYPDFEDFGDLTIRSRHSTGYVRVDWFTPSGLDVWGDVRLFLTGTEGYIELRKNCDIVNRSGANHLYLVDKQGIQYIDCNNVALPFAAQFIEDVLNRTETAMSQEHCFLASELALQAQLQAKLIG